MAKSKKIKIITGKGKNLKVSKVDEHINLEKHQKNISKEKIVIPSEENE